MSIKLYALKRPALGVFFITLFLLLGTARSAPAQTEGNPEWAQAINVSGSGSSQSPTMVQDASGVVYVVWKDQFKGVVYSRLAEGEWSAPSAMTAPWSVNFDPTNPQDVEAVIFTPHFVADGAGRIHAFWIDDTSRLLQTTVEPNQFVNETWSPQVLISEAVVGFEVAVDNDNQLHVSYVSVLDTDAAPAGVYYRRSNTFGGSWNAPIRIYESEYFRGLTAPDLDVQVMVVQNDDGKTVFTTFDNRPRRQFYMARSGDGGTTWDAPILVAGPASSVDANVPNGVGLAYSNDQVLLIWRKVEVETPSNCVQYYQTYNLDGSPRDVAQTMFNELDGCPVGEESVIAEDNRVILLAQVFTETYLIAWDGDRWSPPQVQFELSNFVDPVTFVTVDLECFEMLMGAPDVMYLIGCDTGLGGDIWFSTRPATDSSGWFSTTDEWSLPVPLASAGGVISPITLVSDQAGILHAIWAQTDSQFDDNKTIYYARWDGSAWTYILTIIQPAFAKVNTLASAVDPNTGRLYLVWSGGERGEMYFSWANAALAGSASEWSPPIVLPMPRPIGGDADILVDEAGTVYVVYSIPVNEQRGIYFVRSFDNGITWETPILILDGVGNGWEVVGSPSLTRTADGKLHVMIARHPPPEADLSKRLYYTSSTDAGATWSVPLEFVVGEINRHSIGQISGQQIYRYWQESFDNVVTNYIQSSGDGGQSWSETMNFIGLDSLNPTSSIIEDLAGNLHIVQTAEMVDNQLQLQEWLWNGSSWITEKSLELGAGLLSGNSGMAAAVRADVFLGVLVSRASNDPAVTGSQLIFVERQMEIVIPEVPPETPTPIPQPTATPAPTATPEPLAVIETPAAAGPVIEGDANSGNLVIQLAVGFTAALLVVVVASLLINRFIRRGI